MEYSYPRLRQTGWLHWLGLGLLIAAGALGFGALVAYSPPLAAGAWLGVLLLWKAARRLEWVALALFFIVPLGRLTWFDSQGNLDATKFIVAALAMGWALRCMLNRDSKLMTVWTESPVSVWMLFFLLVNMVSLLYVYAPGKGILGLLRAISLFGLYILMVALVRSKRDVKIALVLLLASGFITCLIGLWEAATRQYLWDQLGQDRIMPAQLMTPYGSGGGPQNAMIRIISVFIDANYMGGYMAVLFGIAAGCALAWRNWYVRVVLGGLMLLILYCAILTGSRGGIVGLLVTMLALLVFSKLRIKWFILTAIVIGALAIFPIVDQVVPQFRGGISIEDLKRDQRYGYWQMALHMMADHPITGVGTDNFPALYSFYRVSPALMEKYYCHNIYLQMWAECGIFGLIAIIVLVLSVILTYLAALREATDPSWRALVLGLLAAFLGYAVFSASCNTLRDQPFWILMALSVIVLRATRQPPGAAMLQPGQ